MISLSSAISYLHHHSTLSLHPILHHIHPPHPILHHLYPLHPILQPPPLLTHLHTISLTILSTLLHLLFISSPTHPPQLTMFSTIPPPPFLVNYFTRQCLPYNTTLVLSNPILQLSTSN